MFKVGIIGPESTGKSTLAQYLAQRYHGVNIPEYAREYMENLAPTYQYTYQDVVNIAHHQVAQLQDLQDKAQLQNKVQQQDIQDTAAQQPDLQNIAAQDTVLFFDTELIITKVWLLHKYGECPDFLLDALHKYPMDVYLLCYPDLPWQYDPVRENPDIRQYLFDWYEREVQALDIPYYIIRHNQ